VSFPPLPYPSAVESSFLLAFLFYVQGDRNYLVFSTTGFRGERLITRPFFPFGIPKSFSSVASFCFLVSLFLPPPVGDSSPAPTLRRIRACIFSFPSLRSGHLPVRTRLLGNPTPRCGLPLPPRQASTNDQDTPLTEPFSSAVMGSRAREVSP